jgi:polyferredoxin
MQILKDKRQTLRTFTPILGLLAIMTTSRLVGNINGLAQYGIEARDVFVLLLFPVSLLMGNVYCGWFCPAGLFQRGLYNLGTKFLGKDRQKKWALSKNAQNKIRYMRNGLLVAWLVTLVLTALGLVENQAAYFIKSTLGMGILLISLPFALITERFFCRNFCINGALYGLMNRIGFYRIERTPACVSCGKCNQVCPMGIEVSTIDRVDQNHCISCLKCVDTCPVNKKNTDTIAISLKKAS